MRCGGSCPNPPPLALPIGLAVSTFAAPAEAFHRGVYPQVAPSLAQVNLLGGGRPINVTATLPLVRSAPHFASVSVSYRPRFAFMKGL